jgi:hypothetical protein
LKIHGEIIGGNGRGRGDVVRGRLGEMHEQARVCLVIGGRLYRRRVSRAAFSGWLRIKHGSILAHARIFWYFVGVSVCEYRLADLSSYKARLFVFYALLWACTAVLGLSPGVLSVITRFFWVWNCL